MNKVEKHKLFYNYSLEYLFEILPKDMKREDLEKYFVGDKKDFSCLEDIFEQLINSAQNYQRMPNVIKFEQKRDFFKKKYYLILILEKLQNLLLMTFMKLLKKILK